MAGGGGGPKEKGEVYTWIQMDAFVEANRYSQMTKTGKPIVMAVLHDDDVGDGGGGRKERGVYTWISLSS